MKLVLPIPAVFVLLLLFVFNPTYSQLTCVDSALSFNGNNQYLKLAPNDFSNNNFLKNLSGDYTIECLIKWNGGADFQRIFDFHYGQEYFMFLTTSEGTNHVPRFAISATGLNNPQVLDANMVLTPNVYHHIAVTYSKADSLLTMYIDGENVNSRTVTIAADSVYYGSDAHDSSTNYIGLSPFDTDPQLNANIDEFRISDTVRYAGNFIPTVPFAQDNYTLALYHFDEGSGQQAADASGFNNTAELGYSPDADTSDPTWVTCNIVLASSFLSVTANDINNQVHINWTAIANSNTKYFQIERSTDAVHFVPVTKTNVTASNSYNYVDVSPAKGLNFYRIKEVDINNNFTYSNLVRVNVMGANAFTVYPTIASNSIHVSASTPATIIIFNENGKPVKTVQLSGTSQNIDVSSLPAGAYIIRNTATNSSLKFLKQ